MKNLSKRRERELKVQRGNELRSELDLLNPIRGKDIGNFNPPKFDDRGDRISRKAAGTPPPHRVNRRVRAYWKETSSPDLPTVQGSPFPTPELKAVNKKGVLTKKGVISRRKKETVGVSGIPCESQRSMCCPLKAVIYGKGRKRMCFRCIKVAWRMQGFCPIKVEFIKEVIG